MRMQVGDCVSRSRVMERDAMWADLMSSAGRDKTVLEAKSIMATMRRNQKSLKKQAEREQHRNTERTPSVELLMKAALVWALSDSLALAQDFAQRWQTNFCQSALSPIQSLTQADLQFRSLELMADPRFQKARRDLADPWREEVDIFLMESLLRDFVAMQSDRDLSVPLTALTDKYTALWSHRPKRPRVELLLEGLSDPIFAKKWAWGFRRRWFLGMQRPTNRPALTRDSLRSRVLHQTRSTTQLTFFRCHTNAEKSIRSEVVCGCFRLGCWRECPESMGAAWFTWSA